MHISKSSVLRKLLHQREDKAYQVNYARAVQFFGCLRINVLKVDPLHLRGYYFQTNMMLSCFSAILCLIITTMLSDLLTKEDSPPSPLLKA